MDFLSPQLRDELISELFRVYVPPASPVCQRTLAQLPCSTRRVRESSRPSHQYYRRLLSDRQSSVHRVEGSRKVLSPVSRASDGDCPLVQAGVAMESNTGSSSSSSPVSSSSRDRVAIRQASSPLAADETELKAAVPLEACGADGASASTQRTYGQRRVSDEHKRERNRLTFRRFYQRKQVGSITRS
jgi:hypothetical protein